MTLRPLCAIIATALSALTASGQPNPLDDVERMTNTFISQPDAHAISYDEPAWRAAVERHMAAATDSALREWRPKNLIRIDAASGDATAWCATWARKGQSRLVWMATAKVGEQRETMAFVDDLSSTDSAFVIRHVVNEGLDGICVTDTLGNSAKLTIGDIVSRMAMRIVTSSTDRTDSEKDAAEAVVIKRLNKATSTLTGDLSGMPELTVCDSPDEALRTVTYMLAYSDFSSRCGGWMAMRTKHGTHIERLTDTTHKIGAPEMAVLNSKSWYGALYTSIIQFRQDRKNYYALLGYKGADATTKTRVIEVVSEGTGGQFTFGQAKSFIHPKQRFRRRIFKYSINASMTMRYDAKAEMIVFDHLEANSRIMTGRPEFYGPDLSYDAYLLTDDGWKFQSDIQVTKEKGAQPNKEDEETLAENYEPLNQNRQPRASAGGTSPVPRTTRRSSSSDKWSGQSRQSTSRRTSTSHGNSWLDKGKGNSAPNIRSR